jgi:Lysozyme like domain
MGDIWPYGPPRYTNWQQCYDALLSLGFGKADANILAAIAGAESSYDLAVINDTPSTGDYSCGAWQINYYGNLRAGRVAEFGTPKHLVQSSVSDQAKAARGIWQSQGFGAWSTYNHGDYKAYLNNKLPSGPPPYHQLQTDIALPGPGADSWSPKVTRTAGHLDGAWHTLDNYANAIHALRG